ncbi:MAG TPA: cytochrome c [Terriglobales bacterium]|nr:cytochrome c [Terriglobales bacterium]
MTFMRVLNIQRLGLGLVLAGLPVIAAAQFGRVDPAAVAAGKKTFVTNCSFCHGPDARGGAEGGPDLTQSPVIAGDRTGQQLAAVLQTGRPPRMPPFHLTADQVTELDAYLRQQAMTAQRERAQQATLVGNAQAGEAYFNGPGGCTQCHSVTGDLKGIASKYDPQALQGRMMLPRGSGGWPSNAIPGKPNGAQDVYRQATVRLASGQRFSGDILYISDYDITIQDKTGARRTFARNGAVPKVTISDPLQFHLDHLATMSPSDMHNLTAYLETLQ